MSKLGEAIRRHREEQGLRLRDVADKVGLSVSGLQRVEFGQVIPRLRTIRAIARYFQWTDGEVGQMVMDLVNGRESSGASVDQLARAVRTLSAAAVRAVAAAETAATAGPERGVGTAADDGDFDRGVA